MRTDRDDNAINRVLAAHGMGTLDDQGIVEHLAAMIEDHQHLTELLRACDPELRRDMYEAVRPHLRFRAKPLEDYIIAAKEHAEAAQLPVMDKNGNLQAYSVAAIEVPEVELWVQCHKCGKEAFFFGERKADAIYAMRKQSWAWDELGTDHTCPECLDALE